MQSVMHSSVVGALDRHKQPWERFEGSPECQRRTFRDWALYYSRRRRDNNALHYYNKALGLDASDYMTLYRRSQVKRKLAQTESALIDSRDADVLAISSDRENATIALEICDVLKELNHFETCKVELANKMRRFVGYKTKAFELRMLVTDENIKDALGDALGPFILKNEDVINNINRINREKDFVDPRPLWKVLKEQGKCDVLSILEAKEEILSPIELARRRLLLKIFNQVYFNRSWIDIVYLKDLDTNPNLLLKISPETLPYIREITIKQANVLKKFRKMLQARSPMYYLKYTMNSNPEMLKKHREDFLFRVQYQTRRNMNTTLRTIKKLRAKNDLKELTKYVEEEMGSYYPLKTFRTMPWKFEFINEVYNHLALAYAEQYKVPPHFSIHTKHGLLKLLKLPTDNVIEAVHVVFGDRTAFNNEVAANRRAAAIKKQIGRLEYRMTFAKYSIEKCYLLHQIGQAQLSYNHYDECNFVARRAIEESKNCNSNIWCFLSYMLICKSNASLFKIERVHDTLVSALQVATKLKSQQLVNFIDTCLAHNDDDLARRKQSAASTLQSRDGLSAIKLEEDDDD